MLTRFIPRVRHCSQTRLCTTLTNITTDNSSLQQPATTHHQPYLTKDNTEKLLSHLISGQIDWQTLTNRKSAAALATYKQTRATFNQLVHELLQQQRHEDIALVANILEEGGYNIKGGITTTLLLSYSECGRWAEAVALLQEVQWNGLKGGEWSGLANIRVYNDLVTQSADDDLVDLAFFFFRELRKEEGSKLSTNRKRAIKPLTGGTLFALVESLCRAAEKGTSAFVSNKSVEELCEPIDIKTALQEVLKYFHQWRLPITHNLLNQIVHLTKLLHSHNVVYTVELNNRCAHCSHRLIETTDFTSLCTEMATNVEKYMKTEELFHVADFFIKHFEQRGYHDVLIDAANTMAFLHNKRDPVNRFLATVAQLGAENPAFVVTRHLNKHLPNMDQILAKYGIDLVEVPMYDNFTDDLSMLYLASKCEASTGKQPSIISWDKFRDFPFMTGNRQREFFHWITERQMHFEHKASKLIPASEHNLRFYRKEGGLELADVRSITQKKGGGRKQLNSHQGVFYDANNISGGFHLTTEDGTVCCFTPRV